MKPGELSCTAGGMDPTPALVLVSPLRPASPLLDVNPVAPNFPRGPAVKTPGFHCRKKRGKTYNQEYSTQKGSCSDLVEKSKALQTGKSSENSALPNQPYNMLKEGQNSKTANNEWKSSPAKANLQ